ncbi:MAG: hypothetical protein ACR2PU_00345 [Gammaproteobacteria bacterium]
MRKDSSLNADAWVVKIGGSLYNSKYLIHWLDAISSFSGKNLIIVPGGGPFADQVRQVDDKFNLDQYCAHNMAVLAMQQYGNMLVSLCPSLVAVNSIEKIRQVWDSSKTAVWEPYEMVRDQCTLDKSWDVTSDSLALWFASLLEIKNLLLVKSSEYVLETTDLEMLEKSGCIDSTLQEFAKHNHINIHVSHKSKVEILPGLLHPN